MLHLERYWEEKKSHRVLGAEEWIKRTLYQQIILVAPPVLTEFLPTPRCYFKHFNGKFLDLRVAVKLHLIHSLVFYTHHSHLSAKKRKRQKLSWQVPLYGISAHRSLDFFFIFPSHLWPDKKWQQVLTNWNIFWGDCGLGCWSSSCNWRVAGSNPISLCPGCCVFGQ